jgi:UDP-N-acetyl-D-mannosaminuronate dehydrogenase
VVAVDLGREAVDRLHRGELLVHEPSLPELFAATRDRIHFSSDPAALAGCDLVIVSRDIPTDANDGSDPEIVHRLIEAAIPTCGPGPPWS